MTVRFRPRAHIHYKKNTDAIHCIRIFLFLFYKTCLHLNCEHTKNKKFTLHAHIITFAKQNISTGLIDNVFQNYTKSSILLIKVGKQNVFYKHFERKILRQCLSCKNFLHTHVIPFGMHHGHVKKLHRDIKT